MSQQPQKKYGYTLAQRDEFLLESNAIEGVFDEVAFSQAVEAWEYLIRQKEISIGVILKLHKILMLAQPLMPHERGYLREVDVFVGMKKMLPPHLLRIFLGNWCESTNAAKPDWKLLHIEYENIHPFVDGNGRTGRMLMNWTRLVKNGATMLIIHAGEEQQAYYKWFK